MIKDCLARIGCLTVVLAALAGIWFFREDVAALWRQLEITSSSEPSEELAGRAAAKLEELAAPGGSRSLRLSQAELQSLLTYRAAPILPGGISEPVVEIGDSTLLLSARVDPRELDGLASPEVVERLFSDSARVLLEVHPDVLGPGVARIRVLTLQAGSIVVPTLMLPWILESLDMPGVENAGATLLLPTPGRVARFDVEDGSLVLELMKEGEGPT